jgi:hypothetical protein
MAKARSPGYPTIGLREAIDKVAQIYSRDYQNALPREVVAAHMGYQSLNGKSLGVLSALIKFGLLEGRGNETRVSDLAVKLIAHPPGTPERSEALQEAASLPGLFGELDGRFQGGRASDQALRSYLLTQKFIPPAADMAIRAYRDTKTLVEAEATPYDAEPVEANPMNAVVVAEQPRQNIFAPNVPAPPILPPNVGSAEPYRVSLTAAGGLEVVARLNSVEDAEALREDIDGFIAVLRNREAREMRAAEKRALAVEGLRNTYVKAAGGGDDDLIG